MNVKALECSDLIKAFKMFTCLAVFIAAFKSMKYLISLS